MITSGICTKYARNFKQLSETDLNDLSQILWDNVTFKAIKNKVNSELKKAKKNYSCKKIKGCVRFKDPKQSWNLLTI